jgi:hypothetical protein
MSQLGMLARQEVAFKSQKKGKHCEELSFDDWIKQQPEPETAEAREKRLQEEKQQQREGIRAEYLDALRINPKHAAMMLRIFPQHLADLMPDKGRLPPLEA